MHTLQNTKTGLWSGGQGGRGPALPLRTLSSKTLGVPASQTGYVQHFGLLLFHTSVASAAASPEISSLQFQALREKIQLSGNVTFSI